MFTKEAETMPYNLGAHFHMNAKAAVWWIIARTIVHSSEYCFCEEFGKYLLIINFQMKISIVLYLAKWAICQLICTQAFKEKLAFIDKENVSIYIVLLETWELNQPLPEPAAKLKLYQSVSSV